MQQGFDNIEINETISDITHDRFLVCSIDGQILYSNKAMRNALGYSEAQLKQKNFFDFTAHQHLISAKSIFLHAAEEPSKTHELVLNAKHDIIKLHLRFLRKNDLIYIYGSEIYAEYERLRKKLKTEITNAIKIHRTSLPQGLPSAENISFASLYLPAEELGGDLYDVFKVDHGLLNDYFDQYVCFIADVSGHGLDSAMLAMFVKDTIRSFFSLRHIPGQVLSPKEIMDFFVEQYIKEGYPDEYLVCLSLVVIDLNAKELIYCNAGIHECPLLIRDKEAIIELKHGGLPVSSAIDMEWMKYEEHSISLTEQMTLFLMSDGLSEQRSGTRIYESRIKNLFSEIYSLDAEQIVDEIHCDFTGFVGNEKISDDITLIVVKLLEKIN